MDWIEVGLDGLNYWRVLLAAVVTMVIGYVWYSNALFGEMWRKEVKMTKKQMESTEGMPSMMLKSFILAMISQSVLFAILIASGTVEILDGVLLALVLGLAFNATTIAVNNTYQRRNTTLSVIDAGYQMLSLAAGALVYLIWVV